MITRVPEKWKDIPFTTSRYQVSNLGKVIGPQGVMNGKKHGKYFIIEAYIDGLPDRKGMLLHRLVYYLFRYKNATGTFQNFVDMPLVFHINGIHSHNDVYNLEAWETREDLGEWIAKNFPNKIKNVAKSSIQDVAAEITIEMLKAGKTYVEIAKLVGTSDMSVYRFAKANGLMKRK